MGSLDSVLFGVLHSIVMKKLLTILLVVFITSCTAHSIQSIRKDASVQYHFTVNKDYKTVYDDIRMYLTIHKWVNFSAYTCFLYPEKQSGRIILPGYGIEELIEVTGQPDGTTQIHCYSISAIRTRNFFEKMAQSITSES